MRTRPPAVDGFTIEQRAIILTNSSTPSDWQGMLKATSYELSRSLGDDWVLVEYLSTTDTPSAVALFQSDFVDFQRIAQSVWDAAKHYNQVLHLTPIGVIPAVGVPTAEAVVYCTAEMFSMVKLDDWRS